MVLGLFLAAAIAATPVEDYYPLQPGTKWTYRDDSGSGMESIDEVGSTVEVNKLPAIPVTTSVANHRPELTYYRVDGDTVNVVAYDRKEPLRNPHPVARFSTSKVTWTYLGEITSGFGPVLEQTSGESKPGPKKKFDGKEVETMEVHTKSRYGNDAQAVEVNQTVFYGKGIGMLELQEQTTSGGKSVKRVLKLIKFEPPTK